uniref:trypsin n=1 Tax=Denticeps clupeoides TaxID=299321 RepID=A0AAY4AIY1_9TELE
MKLLLLLSLVGAAGKQGDGRIVGGYECTPNSKPWMASLNYGYHFCGAVLINEQWVLSVAHCCPYAMQIMLGEHDLRVFEATANTTNPIPDSLFKKLFIKIISLLILTDAVRPVALPSGCPYAGMSCSVSGWGNTDAVNGETEKRELSSSLGEANDENKDCESSYPGMITRNMMCAGYLDGGKGVCNGDSGSPLICQGEVHGLVSWGQGCAQPNYPAVYVKVCEFLYWISDTLEANA